MVTTMLILGLLQIFADLALIKGPQVDGPWFSKCALLKSNLKHSLVR